MQVLGIEVIASWWSQTQKKSQFSARGSKGQGELCGCGNKGINRDRTAHAEMH